MEKEIPKTFDSNEKELQIYSLWEESGYSNPDEMEEFLKAEGIDVKDPFTITLPPPNANGNLHLGHVCGYSFHDVIGRYMRMTGHSYSTFTRKRSCWNPDRECFFKSA